MTAPSGRGPAAWRQGRPAFVLSATARLALGVLVLLMAVSVLPSLVGWQASVVMSGSMAPTLDAGDVVVVRPVGPAALRPGRIVLVDDPDVAGQLRMHRIASVDGGLLRLKGDANPQADGSRVPLRAVHGVGVLRLPRLGLPFVWLREGRTGPVVLAGLALAALVAAALVHRPASPSPGSGPGPASGRALRKGRPRRRWVGPRMIALCGVAALIGGLGTAADAGAVFYAVTSNPSSSFTAAQYWSCGNAAAAAGATQYYPLQEAAGPTAVNSGTAGSAANAAYSPYGISYRVTPGPRCAVGQQSAVWLDGASGAIAAGNAVTNPTAFTEQIWFATWTTRGGKLIGLGSSRTGESGNYDRHIYMLNSGRLAFGVYDGSTRVVTSSAAYNDSRWHLASATFSGSAGMTLYVDGVEVGRDSSARTAQNFTGYWRIGYDNLNGWPNAPTSYHFNGAVAHAAVFPTALSAAQVAAQAAAGPWSCAAAAGPNGSAATLYLPLQETSLSTAVNSGSGGAAGNGTYSGSGVSSVYPGPNCGVNAFRAIQLDGVAGQIWTTQAVSSPQNFTVQIWFATTTTTGGKIIGFGNGTGGAASSKFDRHIYMSDDGKLTFGVYNGGHHTITTPAAYNDGAWHLATGTFSPGTGMAFYVDGELVGTNQQATAAETNTGYWRIGYDSMGSWPNSPTSPWFAGKVAQASVYYRVLAADEIAGQYLAGH